MKCWTTAKSRSFYARDNVANFLKWCRTLGVREAVLFETEDLVSQRCAKNVVLCLLEVARIACSLLQFSPCPGLVQLEHEIDLLEQQEEHDLQNNTLTNYTQKHEQSQQTKGSLNKSHENEMQQLYDLLDVHPINQDTTDATSSSSVYHLNQDIRKAEICLVNSDLENQMTNNGINLAEDDICKNLLNTNCSTDPSAHSSGDELSMLSSCDLQSYVRSGRDLQMSRSYSSISADSVTESKCSNTSQAAVSQLDQKVMLIAKTYYGKKAKTGIQRIKEGKYKIAGKIVFIRLLKNKHVMVRVGGGWQTLSYFLERHGSDISAQQISAADLLPMDTRPAQCTSRKKTQNSLHAANTQQLCNFASSQMSSDHLDQEHPLRQQSNIGSKSSHEISNRTNQLNYNMTNSGLRRCLSSTPVLSSPEPVSSGYCSSTTSNSNTAISNQSIINEHRSMCSTTDDNWQMMNDGRKNDTKVKYTIDGYQSSNTSLNSCDRVLIKSDLMKDSTKKQESSIEQTIEDMNSRKEVINDMRQQSIKHTVPCSTVSSIKKPKSLLRKTESLNEKNSHIPTFSSHTTNVSLAIKSTPQNHQDQSSNQMQQTIRQKQLKTSNDNNRSCRNAFGFVHTPTISMNNKSPVEHAKSITMSIALHPSSNKRDLATSLSSLPTTGNCIPTMLPVLQRQTTSLRKPTFSTHSNISKQHIPSNGTPKIIRGRSMSIQNVNSVSSPNFGFNGSSTTIKIKTTTSSAIANMNPMTITTLNRPTTANNVLNQHKTRHQYTSSTSLNNVPSSRSKNCVKLNFNSAKTRSTNHLDHIGQETVLANQKNRYPNYLSSSQHITKN